MCWLRKSMTRGEKKIIKYIEVKFPFLSKFSFLSTEIQYVSPWQTFRNSVMFKLFFK